MICIGRAATIALFGLPVFGCDAEPLTGYGIALDQTSVSGISSGGAMAVQMHVAHASIMRGVGVTAGVAYDCADSQAWLPGMRTLNVTFCMNGLIPWTRSRQRTEAAAQAGAIDPTADLAGQRVWLMRGGQDDRIHLAAMEALESYYHHYAGAADVVFDRVPDAAHAQITDDYGPECPTRDADIMSDCDYDAAGELLAHIYDDAPLQPKTTGALGGAIVAFSQGPFADGTPRPYGLGDTGYLYVPAACDDPDLPPCPVHVALHGCKQSAQSIGDTFYTEAGYNEWADTNGIIVLYPQTQPVTYLGNSGAFDLDAGCWDWFGYSGFTLTGVYDRDYARKDGYQIAAIRRMLDCLAKPHGASC